MYNNIIYFIKHRLILIVLLVFVISLCSILLLRYVFAETAQIQPIQPSSIVAGQKNSSTCPEGYQWCFEGTTVPGEYQSPSMMWDNPIDDQWKRQDFRDHVYSMLNEGEGSSTTSYVHTDRSTIDGPSWIMLKDPKMDYSSGFNVKLSVRVPSTSDRGAVAFIAITDKNHFAVIFENNRIIFNPVGNQRYWGRKYTAYPLNLSEHFSTISITQDPGNYKVNVSLINPDGTKTTIFSDATSTLQTRDLGFRTQLSFGDNQDDYVSATGTLVKVRSVYDLDFIRIKKLLTTTDQYPAPTKTSVSSQDSRFIGLLSATSTSGNIKFSQTIKDFNPSYEDDLSVVWKMSLSSLKEEKVHFSIFLKGLSYAFSFSDEGVRFKTYGKPVSSPPVEFSSLIDNKNEACFRFVHKANSPYADLYINNNPQPLILNAKGSAAGWTTTSRAFVLFGKEMVPDDIEEAWSMKGDLPGSGAYKGSTTLSFIKFTQGAYLPKLQDTNCEDPEILSITSPTIPVTVVAPGQKLVKTADLNLDATTMKQDLYLNSFNAKYVSNSNLNFKNCVAYQGALRLNGAAVNTTGSGIVNFVLDRALYVKKGTSTSLIISCTIPQGSPIQYASAQWEEIIFPLQSNFTTKNYFSPTAIHIVK